MGNMLQIEFEKGGKFDATLLENEAPKTCGVIWNSLPLHIQFYHSIVSGRALVSLPKGLNVEPENQSVMGIPPGAITFLVRDPPRLVPDEIYIVYGIFVSRGLTLNNYQPVNYFAQIETGLDKLKEVGQRVLMQGAENVTFTKKS